MALTDHRTTRPLLAVATLSTLCLGLAACGGSDSGVTVTPGKTTAASAPTAATSSESSPSESSSSSSESSAPSSESADPSASSSAAPAAFKAGQCLNDTTNWESTPCDQQHKLEVISVVKTGKYADDLVKRGILRNWTCNNELAAYIGNKDAGFARILAQPVPTATDPNASKQIVCAAAVTKPDDTGYEQITYRLKNRIKTKGYTDYRICTSDRPSKTDSPHIVPCDEAHKAETIGGYVIGKPDGKYPGSNTVDKRALKKCVPLAKKYLGTTRGDVIAAVNSTGESGWKRGTTMTACFVEATNGTFTKPLKGMKNKPLSSYK
ncbi:septum formation family protein [Flexivirga sp. B27]